MGLQPLSRTHPISTGKNLLDVLLCREGRQLYGCFNGILQTADKAETHFAQYGNSTRQNLDSHLVFANLATPTKTLANQDGRAERRQGVTLQEVPPQSSPQRIYL